MKKLITAFIRDTEGQDLIEYALLAATIALGAVLAMQGLRDAISTQFSNIGTSINSGS
jgi:Flp pilus assembly pilin Flp